MDIHYLHTKRFQSCFCFIMGKLLSQVFELLLLRLAPFYTKWKTKLFQRISLWERERTLERRNFVFFLINVNFWIMFLLCFVFVSLLHHSMPFTNDIERWATVHMCVESSLRLLLSCKIIKKHFCLIFIYLGIKHIFSISQCYKLIIKQLISYIFLACASHTMIF